MFKEVRVERKGYGFEPENPIYVREQDLYDYMLALHLDKDSTGKTIQHCSACSSFPVQEKSTENVRCISVCFQTEIDKLEIYELYFCLEDLDTSKKSFLHTQIPQGFKMKVVEVLTVLAKGNAEKPVEKQRIVKSGSGQEFDELLPQALAECILVGQASASFLRRRFEIGYPKAMRIIDEMEEAGFISPLQGPAGREIYVSKEEYKALFGHEPQPMTKEVENKRKAMSEDEILKDALRLIFEEGFVPTASGLRRKYDISYPKAVRVIDKMEDFGYISKQEVCGPRQVLITKDEYLKLIKEGK